MSMKFVPEGAIDIKLQLIQARAWHPTGTMPLPGVMMA